MALVSALVLLGLRTFGKPFEDVEFTHPDVSSAQDRAQISTKDEIVCSLDSHQPGRPLWQLEYALPWGDCFVTLHRGVELPDRLSIYAKEVEGKYRLIRRMIFADSVTGRVESYQRWSDLRSVDFYYDALSGTSGSLNVLSIREGWKRGSSPLFFYRTSSGQLEELPWENALDGYRRLTKRLAYPGRKSEWHSLAETFVGGFTDVGPDTDAQQEEAKLGGYKSAGEVTVSYQVIATPAADGSPRFRLVATGVKSKLDH